MFLSSHRFHLIQVLDRPHLSHLFHLLPHFPIFSPTLHSISFHFVCHDNWSRSILIHAIQDRLRAAAAAILSDVIVVFLPLPLLPIRWFQRNGRSERCHQPGGIDDPEGRIATRNGVFQIAYDFGEIIRTRATEGLASCGYGGNNDCMWLD